MQELHYVTQILLPINPRFQHFLLYYRFIPDLIGLMFIISQISKIIKVISSWLKTCVFVDMSKVGVFLFCINQSFIKRLLQIFSLAYIGQSFISGCCLYKGHVYSSWSFVYFQ